MFIITLNPVFTKAVESIIVTSIKQLKSPVHRRVGGGGGGGGGTLREAQKLALPLHRQTVSMQTRIVLLVVTKYGCDTDTGR